MKQTFIYVLKLLFATRHQRVDDIHTDIYMAYILIRTYRKFCFLLCII
jgi:hypothetical protein